MTKREERLVTELYDVTERITEPEITPVLRGSCRIQGPVNETVQDVQKNTGSYRGENFFGGHSLICMRPKSGTCNVCAAPCSSCMHFNRSVSLMELKSEDECSDESSRGKAASRCSFNVADIFSLSKSKAIQTRQCAAASDQISNLLSACSSHDSFSENAESKATDDLEKVSLGGIVTEVRCPLRQPESVSSHVVCDVEQRNFSYEEHRGLECHGDNISCVSGANDADSAVADHPNSNVERKNVSSSSASVSSLLPERSEKADFVQLVLGRSDDIKVEGNCGKFRRPSMCTKDAIPKSPTSALAVGSYLAKSAQKEVPSPEVRSPCSHSRSGKLALFNTDTKDLEESSCSRRQVDPFESSTVQVDLSLPKVSPGKSASADKQTTDNGDGVLPKNESSKASHMGISSSGVSDKNFPCPKAGIDMDSGDAPSESMKCLDLNEKVEKPVVLLEAPAVQEPPLQSLSQPVDESDGSEMEEDVKVCDICGDAGREDLLAVCSRCGDGAEHTYCMRVMVDKVPEGDWLCEECKIKEAENQGQDKSEAVVEPTRASFVNDKSLKSETMVNPKPSTKSYNIASDLESNLSPKIGGSNLQISSKRRLDSAERSSAAKRQALETSSGTPKPLSPCKKAALSRESSFKNLHKERLKLVHQIHSPTSGPNPSRNQSRHLPRGTLLKSNSFTGLSSKPKVKMVKEDFTLKSKLTRDNAGETKKAVLGRAVGKSLSFHSGSSRSNSTFSKLKVETSGLYGKDKLRGLKLTKDHSSVERKNSFRTDRSLVTSPTRVSSGATTPKVEKIAHRGENTSASCQATNYHCLKNNQPAGKSSKPPQISVNRGLDSPKSIGGCSDLKRQSSCLPHGILSPSPKEIYNSFKRKATKVSLKDETTSISSMANKLSSNPEVILRDPSQEPTSQSRQNILAGDSSTRCQKCKEIGHTAQFCSVVDGSAARSSSDVMNKSSKFKLAVEAAMSRRSVERRKSRTPYQSMSCNDMNCEVAPEDQSSISSSCLKGLISDDMVHDGQESLRGLASSVIFPLSSLSIPEYDYIWQGGFEVQKSGRFVEFFDGIQAHLSTCASPKVPEVVNKFPYKVLLEQVPRSTAWPAQFRNQVTEDNIALYFFAKDIESYERNYKSLLEDMMKDDLALKGNYNGVELLIYPSNQLTGRSHRWNTLFYMWGVFKVRRVNCSEDISSSQIKICGTNLNEVQFDRELPSLAQVGSHRHFPGNVKDLSTCSKSVDAQEATKSSGSMDLPFSLSSVREDTNFHKEGVSVDHEHANLHSTSKHLRSDFCTNSLFEISKIDALAHKEMKGNNMSTEENRDVERREMELDTCSILVSSNGDLHSGNNTVQMDLNKFNSDQINGPSTSPDWKVRSSGSNPISTSSLVQDLNLVRSTIEDNIKDRSNRDEVILIENIKDEEDKIVDTRTAFPGDLVKQEYNNSSEMKSSRKRPYLPYSDVLLQGSGETSTSTSQSMPWSKVDYVLVDKENECKKLKTSYGEISGSSNSTSQISLSERFPMKDRERDETYEDTVTGEMRKTERFFFTVDLNRSNDWTVENNSVPLQVISSDDEDQPEPDFPNLELALGAEKRPSSQQGVLPLFVGLDEKKAQSKRPCAEDIIKKPDDKKDVVSGSLSLSLAFPLTSDDKEQTTTITTTTTLNPVSKPEHLLSERRGHPSLNIGTSILDLAL